MVRKHTGIHQSGKHAGRLKKGFCFTGKKTKKGLPCIRRVKKTNKTKKKRMTGGEEICNKDFVDKAVAVLQNNMNCPCTNAGCYCRRTSVFTAMDGLRDSCQPDNVPLNPEATLEDLLRANHKHL